MGAFEACLPIKVIRRFRKEIREFFYRISQNLWSLCAILNYIKLFEVGIKNQITISINVTLLVRVFEACLPIKQVIHYFFLRDKDHYIKA